MAERLTRIERLGHSTDRVAIDHPCAKTKIAASKSPKMNLKGVVTSNFRFHKLINCFDRFDIEIAVGANKYQ